MNSISATYTLKFELKFAPEYKWTKCGKCFNVKSGRQIKQVYNNGCIGYSIKGNFKSLKYLRTQLIKIQLITCPF
jgi:hypothetical protein